MVQNSEEKILIVRESSDYVEGSLKGIYDVVGGRISSEESLIDGLKREVKEEAGLEVEIGELVHVDEKFQEIKGEKVHIVRIYYQCTSDSSEVVLSKDHDSFEWIEPHNHKNFNLFYDVAEVFDKWIEKGV